MKQMANSTAEQIRLDDLLENAVKALAVLDAEAIESLAASLSGARRPIELPLSSADWKLAVSQRSTKSHRSATPWPSFARRQLST